MRWLTAGVGLERGIVEVRQIDPVVKDRPDRAVGEVDVVVGVFLVAEIGENEIDALVLKAGRALGDVLGEGSGPADPHAVRGFQRIPHRHRQPSGPTARIRGSSVGNCDQTHRAESFRSHRVPADSRSRQALL